MLGIIAPQVLILAKKLATKEATVLQTPITEARCCSKRTITLYSRTNNLNCRRAGIVQIKLPIASLIVAESQELGMPSHSQEKNFWKNLVRFGRIWLDLGKI